MSDIRVIKFKTGDALDILERNIRERDIWLTVVPDWEKVIDGWEKGGPAYTLVVDGNIVGCAGVVLFPYNHGEAWALLSSLFYKNVKTAYRAVKEGLSKIIKEHHLIRVQSLACPTSETAHRFLKHLGFKDSGLQECYGPNGEDFIMFAKINKEKSNG